ncbi:MAG: DUF1801 domain-containing protein [Isosphaeraceae bacterium]|nr:DUF1801 domain-containing protein [Isosphaeraceae bacterium]
MPSSTSSVEEYLAQAPPDRRAVLDSIRRELLSIVPDAEERISYGVPALRRGRMIVGYGMNKQGYALYLMSPSVAAEFAEELAAFDTSPGTIRFSEEHRIPPALLRRLVEARLAENQALDAAVALAKSARARERRRST